MLTTPASATDVLQAVIDERAPPGADNEANTDGSSCFYGAALINSDEGSDPWPEVCPRPRWTPQSPVPPQLRRAHGRSDGFVIDHEEWQPGKPDPSFFERLPRPRRALPQGQLLGREADPRRLCAPVRRGVGWAGNGQ
ncbi:hypothetical protein ABR738_12935 [Streptomyces sp. Edi4]|uniref:hypothetical protein n=1 Tax=Streptomyces sp. Edi4 TaxID=3162527 RepID=UPI00330578B3